MPVSPTGLLGSRGGHGRRDGHVLCHGSSGDVGSGGGSLVRGRGGGGISRGGRRRIGSGKGRDGLVDRSLLCHRGGGGDGGIGCRHGGDGLVHRGGSRHRGRVGDGGGLVGGLERGHRGISRADDGRQGRGCHIGRGGSPCRCGGIFGGGLTTWSAGDLESCQSMSSTHLVCCLGHGDRRLSPVTPTSSSASSARPASSSFASARLKGSRTGAGNKSSKREELHGCILVGAKVMRAKRGLKRVRCGLTKGLGGNGRNEGADLLSCVQD